MGPVCVYHSLDIVWPGWSYWSNSKGEIKRVLVGLYQERGNPSPRGHVARFWRGFLRTDGLAFLNGSASPGSWTALTRPYLVLCHHSHVRSSSCPGR